ncbi:MAG: carboxymuconolactone decarboxylase family protein [Candidatus Acidiferrales bacterium]
MALVRSLPQSAVLADLRRAVPELFDKLRPYGQQLMRGPSPLTPGQRELIAAYVSGVNSCRFCHGTHARVAQAFGMEEGTIKTLLDDIDLAPVEPRLKPILRYARKLTETPNRMTEADAAAVYDAGWSDEALIHAIAVCAYFNNMNRLVEGAGIVGTGRDYSAGAERLVADGYLTGGDSTLPKPPANRRKVASATRRSTSAATMARGKSK